MSESKLEALLKSFSSSDLQQFRKFLLSPFFNENENLLKLFEALPGNANKASLWKTLFHKTPYNDQTLRRLKSELTRHALSFRAWQAFQQDPLAETAALLPTLLNPALNKHFEGVHRQANYILDRMPSQSPAIFHTRFLIEKARHQKLEASGKKPDTLSFLEAADARLDEFYLVQKLKNFCEALSYQKNLALDAQLGQIPGMFEYLDHSPYAAVPLIRAYRLVLEMLRNPDDDQSFLSLRALLHEAGGNFEKKERHTLFTHLLNYCIDTKINRGHTEYFDELFALYQVALEREIILEDGRLDPFHYKNIITVGLRIDALEWTERFIQEYTPALPPSQQANALTYNLAKVYFQQKRYEKVIEQLREVEYQDLVYSLGAKLMLLKTYYELGEYLSLDSLSESFRIFLQRNKLLSREVKQQYMNVLRFVKKLSRMRPKDAAALEKIRRDVQKCQALADKPWILEKISELE